PSEVVTRTSPAASRASTGSCPGRMPISPSIVRATTKLASPVQTSWSAATTLTDSRRSATSGHLLLDARPVALDVGDAADVEERLLGHVVVLALHDRVERLDRLLERHGRAFDTRE